MKKCKQCGKEFLELDPSGPEQVNNPMYAPDCECEGEQEEDKEKIKEAYQLLDPEEYLSNE